MDISKVRILVSAIQKLSLARDLDRIMDIVRRSARQLVGADGATFVLKEGEKCYYADEDAISPLWKGQKFPISACISGWCMINKKFVVIEDIYNDERVPIEAYRPTFVKSLAMVPIRTINPVGAIGVYWAKLHSPTDEDVEVLQSLADITSVSIENVFVYEELKEQNKILYDIAFLQSHQVRVPVAQLKGLFELINFDDLSFEKNSEIFERIKITVDSFDKTILEITEMS
ncbi:MAG TPA: GAF domain-containing protein, partial [Flavobacteriales bacterium]|nr:GAF domain-containing protein [Flavobacteriales bacterium]